MSDTSDLFKELLKEQGYSLTKQRLHIFNILLDSEPLSMNEVTLRAAGKVDRASTYRIVMLFEKLGIAQRLYNGWKYKIELSDKFAEHHHHLTCRKCGKVIPINEHSMESFINNLAAQNDFLALSHQIEIQGLCADCKQYSKETALIAE